MPCNRRKIRAKVVASDVRVVLGLHRLRSVAWVCAVAATEGQVVGSVHHSNGLGEIWRHAACTTDAVELAECD